MYWFSEVLESQNVHCGGSGFYNRDYFSSEMVQKKVGLVSNGPPWLQCPVRKTFFCEDWEEPGCTFSGGFCTGPPDPPASALLTLQFPYPKIKNPSRYCPLSTDTSWAYIDTKSSMLPWQLCENANLILGVLPGGSCLPLSLLEVFLLLAVPANRTQDQHARQGVLFVQHILKKVSPFNKSRSHEHILYMTSAERARGISGHWEIIF